MKEKYFIHKNGSLVIQLPEGNYCNWVELPEDFQDINMADLYFSNSVWGILIAHAELQPRLLRNGQWKLPKLAAVLAKNFLQPKIMKLKEKRKQLSAIEQRDKFQKQYPHLVSPKYYRQGNIEPWDFITSQGLGFLEGNVIKYITRYKNKNGLEDLKKAQTYLNKLIQEVECQSEK